MNLHPDGAIGDTLNARFPHCTMMNSVLFPPFRSRRLLLSALLALAGVAASALAMAAGSATIQAEDAWVRQPPPGAAAAGAYARLTNTGAADDRLLAVDGTAAARVEIHEMHTLDGMMRMRALDDGLALPAGQTVTLAPGGLHLMLISPTAALHPGDTVTMTLHFEHAPEQTLTFTVRPLLDGEDMRGHDHGRHGEHAHHGGQ